MVSFQMNRAVPRALLIARHLSKTKLLVHSADVKLNESPPEVLFEKKNYGRIICLNRKRALNAINNNMLDLIIPKFESWIGSPNCNLIIFKSNNPKAYCAGGDVKAVVKLLKSGDQNGMLSFFRKEYKFIQKLATSPKPLVSFMDGITMGGGVGLSAHAAFRVATENTLFAMPETSIGLFPDVGGSYLLGQLDTIGIFLALTGTILGPIDVMALRLASHYVPSHLLPRLTDRLCELGSASHYSIYQAIEEFSEPSPQLASNTEINSEIFKHRECIQRIFKNSSIEEIFKLLSIEKGTSAEFAKITLDKLKLCSPLSLHLTLKMLKICKNLSFKDWMQREWILANTIGLHSDLIDGVTAKLIEKREIVEWKSKTMTKKEMDELWNSPKNFKPLDLNSFDFIRSPYSCFCLPSENLLKNLLQTSTKKFYNFDEVIDWFDKFWPMQSMVENTNIFLKNSRLSQQNLLLVGSGKIGLKEHIRSLLNIFCIQKDDVVVWNG